MTITSILQIVTYINLMTSLESFIHRVHTAERSRRSGSDADGPKAGRYRVQSWCGGCAQNQHQTGGPAAAE
jgi:hypothetical protein